MHSPPATRLARNCKPESKRVRCTNQFIGVYNLLKATCIICPASLRHHTVLLLLNVFKYRLLLLGDCYCEAITRSPTEVPGMNTLKQTCHRPDSTQEETAYSINVIQCLKYNVVPNKCSCSAHALQASRFCTLPFLWLQGGTLDRAIQGHVCA